MSFFRNPVRQYGAALAVLLCLAAWAPAKNRPNPKFANIQIDNFGQINQNYYRGAQPEGDDYADLAALGIKTVIDLTRDGNAYEQARVEREGMRFYRIPMTTSARPGDAAVRQFLNLVNNPANMPVYVHCQGGRHRTGAMTAVYRMTQDGWNPDQAYAEMKQYRFEGFPGHPELKSFVYDYYKQLVHSRPPVNQTPKLVTLGAAVSSSPR